MFGACLQADRSGEPFDRCRRFPGAAERRRMVRRRWFGSRPHHGADIEARGPFEQSALASCACNQVDRRKRSRTLRLLLASGADVNGRIDRGRTPLFSAATAGWAPEESVEILLEHGADPHIRNDDGQTVLEEVLMRPTARAQRVARLLHHAADPQ